MVYLLGNNPDDNESHVVHREPGDAPILQFHPYSGRFGDLPGFTHLAGHQVTVVETDFDNGDMTEVVHITQRGVDLVGEILQIPTDPLFKNAKAVKWKN